MQFPCSKRNPKLLISSSATGFYGDTGDEEFDETGAKGEGFLADVCDAWKKLLFKPKDMVFLFQL